ncbi:MAG: hypothetical protein AB7U20_03870 [Planctomycetaceae bacterium]
MSAVLDELVNRVAARLWQVVSAKIASHVELEVVRTQAELLEQAAAFRRGHSKLGEQVARRLETVSERLVHELFDETAEVDTRTSLWSGGGSTNAVDGTLDNSITESNQGKRPRGRPRKVPAGDGVSTPIPTRDLTRTPLE